MNPRAACGSIVSKFKPIMYSIFLLSFVYFTSANTAFFKVHKGAFLPLGY